MRGLRLFRIMARSEQGACKGQPLVFLAVLGLALPLGALHAWLLWVRISQGRLLEWSIALRWAAAAVLLLTLAALRQRGVPLFWGRRALAVWTLVLLLHWAAPAPAVGAEDLPSSPPILFVLPASAGSLALAVGLLWAGRARRAHPAPPREVPRPRDERRPAPLAGFPLLLFARPPPA